MHFKTFLNSLNKDKTQYLLSEAHILKFTMNRSMIYFQIRI